MDNLPNKNNWDRFWGDDKTLRFTRKSWSKVRMIKLLDEILKKDMKILDAGCGSGFFSAYFLSRGCKVYPLDYSEEALNITRKATKNRAKEYIKQDLLNPHFGRRYANMFDIVFSDGLFEHFKEEDQLKIMENFKIVKRKNGLITTFVPNKYSWWEIIRPIFMPGIKEDPFTMKRLLDLNSDMIIVKKGGINVLPFFISPDKILGSKLGMILYCFAK